MDFVTVHDAAIPAIGMGTWTLKDDHCRRMVEAALAIGYRHIDTARMYGNEREVGAALRASGLPREAVFVTTKVWYTDLAPQELRRSAEASLEDLGLDYVDLLLVHWPNPEIPLDRTMAALARLREEGRTRHIGVSNFTVPLLHQAIASTEVPLVCNQVEYHPYLDQSKVKRVLQEAGMALVSYCPLYRGHTLLDEPAIRAVASRHGRSPAQIVLRWHIQQPHVVAIPRTSRPERLEENLAVFDFALTEEEMTAISALKRRRPRICDYDFSPDWDN
jgi:diketogulonate reductase-like aldo/keto reductase